MNNYSGAGYLVLGVARMNEEVPTSETRAMITFSKNDKFEIDIFDKKLLNSYHGDFDINNLKTFCLTTLSAIAEMEMKNKNEI